VAKSKQQQLVDDRLWELLEPLIPPRPPARGPGGRPPIADRACGVGFRHGWRAAVAQGLAAGLHHAVHDRDLGVGAVSRPQLRLAAALLVAAAVLSERCPRGVVGARQRTDGIRADVVVTSRRSVLPSAPREGTSPYVPAVTTVRSTPRITTKRGTAVNARTRPAASRRSTVLSAMLPT
jgi:hypothetical protein